MDLGHSVFRILINIWIYVSSSQCSQVDVCQAGELQASCEEDYVIMMDTSRYGRMDAGQCLSTGPYGCSDDVTHLTDQWCSGRRQCEFHVPNSDLLSASQCGEVVSFLRAQYTCVNVPHHSSTFGCDLAQDEIITNDISPGYGCGSSRSPWTISAHVGENIALALWDFKALARAKNQETRTCPEVYGYVLERSLNINVTLCGGVTRQGQVYVSKTNTVEVVVVGNSAAKFFIKYTTGGCKDPDPPPNAWYKRNGNEAVIGCDSSDKEWRLTCSDRHWKGKVGNCSASPGAGPATGPQTSSADMSTIVGVAGIIGATIILAVAVIVSGVVYLQKYEEKLEKLYAEDNINMDTLHAHYNCHTHHISLEDIIEAEHEQDSAHNAHTFPRSTVGRGEQPLVQLWETSVPEYELADTCTVHRQPHRPQLVVQQAEGGVITQDLTMHRGNVHGLSTMQDRRPQMSTMRRDNVDGHSSTLDRRPMHDRRPQESTMNRDNMAGLNTLQARRQQNSPMQRDHLPGLRTMQRDNVNGFGTIQGRTPQNAQRGMTTLDRDPSRLLAVHYDPNTGHKYYVLDNNIK